MKDLSVLHERCASHWIKQHSYGGGWPEPESSGIEIFPYTTGDLSFQELVKQMEAAHDAYPAVHQQDYPLWGGRNDTITHRGCAYALNVQELNDEQLNAVCNRKDVPNIPPRAAMPPAQE